MTSSFSKLRFPSTLTRNMKPAFSDSSGLNSAIENPIQKHLFRDGLVRSTVGLTTEIKPRFQIFRRKYVIRRVTECIWDRSGWRILQVISLRFCKFPTPLALQNYQHQPDLDEDMIDNRSHTLDFKLVVK